MNEIIWVRKEYHLSEYIFLLSLPSCPKTESCTFNPRYMQMLLKVMSMQLEDETSMMTGLASAELRGSLNAMEMLFVIQEVEGSNPAYLGNIYVGFSSRFIVLISSDVMFFSVHLICF
jgi:hypothetical protein